MLFEMVNTVYPNKSWLWLALASIYCIIIIKLGMLLSTWILSLWRHWSRISAVRKLPGADPHWFWGHLHLFSSLNETSFKLFQDVINANPKVTKLFIGFLKPVVVCVHPETVKPILKNIHQTKSVGFGGTTAGLKTALKNGLLVVNGKQWQQNRKLLTPAFHFGILKSYVKIYNESASTLMMKWNSETEKGMSVEIYEPLCLYSFDVFLSSAFSYDKNVQLEEDSFGDAVVRASEIVLERLMTPWMFFDTLFYISPQGREFVQCMKIGNTFAMELIKNRRFENNHKEKSEMKTDFLNMLLLARDDDDKGLSDAEILQEIQTFLVAAHTTTSTGIAWLLYFLAKYPHCQTKCRQEVKAICGKSQDMDVDSLSKLPYLTQCIKEGMRLHPPVPNITRELTNPLVIDGHKIPIGTEVAIPIYFVHHNRTVWGENHEEFIPERFSAEKVRTMDPFAFIPFAAGTRNCIGQNMAMDEMKVVVARILQEYELVVDESHPIERRMDLVLTPVHGIKLFLKKIIP